MHNNLRIVSDNAADRATITTTPSAVAGLGVEHLGTEIRAEVCRVLANAVQIVVVLDALQAIGCVAIPACNLSSRATMRVRGYDAEVGGELRIDTDVQYAAPGVNLGHWDPSQNLNVNAFGDGPATVAAWFQHVPLRRIVIDIEDPLREYIDLSRLVIGRYWEPKYNPAYGAALGFEDSTTNTRAESGDIRTDLGTQHRILTLPMEWVDATDRHRVTGILRQGLGRRHFVSVTPDGSDVGLEQDYMLYGVLRQLGDVAYTAPTLHQTQFQFQEW